MSKGKKLAQRLSHILALLHQGDAIDKHQLALDFQVDVRTIERDLGERLLHIAERNGDGRWQLTHAARSTVPARNLNDYANWPARNICFPIPACASCLNSCKRRRRNAPCMCSPPRRKTCGAETRHFPSCSKPFRRSTSAALNTRTSPGGPAVPAYPQERHLVSGCHRGRPAQEFQRQPYWRAARRCRKRFTPDPTHHDYINNKDDVWFTPDTTEVLLRVSPEAAHYFTRRPLLPQQLNRTGPDGSLLVTTQISHPQQLLPLVRYWLPHVRILQPAALRHALLESLQDAIASWEQE